MSKIFDRNAVFSDETQQFVTPYNPNIGDSVTFKLRLAKDNNCEVCLHICDISDTVCLMQKLEKNPSSDIFDYYTTTFTAPARPVRYFYTIVNNGEIFYFNKQGLRDSLNDHYNFRFISGVKVPEWARGAIMYQIFVDRFCNGDSSNDVLSHEYAYLGVTPKALSWDKGIYNEDFCNFYGGDLQGIINKISYIKSLGVEAIYLSPIFVSPSSHKYDVQDYDHVDPHYGVIQEDGGDILSFGNVHNHMATKYKRRTTSKVNLEASNKLLASFIAKAHENGIKVILDGVFNHCGSFHKWLDIAGFYDDYNDGAYQHKNSPYHNYFLWDNDEWPSNNSYKGWWDNSNHPKLNFEGSQKLCDYILQIGAKWVSPPYNADGWRLDVAADLGLSTDFNHAFWKKFNNAVKTANPNAIILAEHYGDPSHWLYGDEWDTVMNYDAFMEPITWFLTGVNKHSEESRPYMKGDALAFESAMRYHMSQLNIHALQMAMNQISNHDHSRFLTRTNGNTGRWHVVGSAMADVGVNKSIMMQAVIFQMTWPGAPTIYYGDEAGLTGWTDPDNRRTFPWGKEDTVLMSLHVSLAKIRNGYPMLRHGSVEFLWMQENFISFGRWDDVQKIAVAINSGAQALEIELPVWKLDITKGEVVQLLESFNGEYSVAPKTYIANDGIVKIKVEPQGAIILGV